MGQRWEVQQLMMSCKCVALTRWRGAPIEFHPILPFSFSLLEPIR